MKTTRAMKLNAMALGGKITEHTYYEETNPNTILFHHKNREKVEKFAEKFFVGYTITGCKDLGYTAYCHLEK